MGEREKALALLDLHADLSEGHSVSTPSVRDFLSLRAQLLSRVGRDTEAEQISELLQKGGANTADAVAVTARLKLAEADNKPTETERHAAADEAIALLRDAINQADEIQGVPDVLLGLAEELNIALSSLGRYGEAEEAVRNALDRINPENAPRTWLLQYCAMRHALRRKDAAAVAKDVFST